MRRVKAGVKDPMDLVWPSHLQLFPDYVEVGDYCARSYVVVGYPREVQPGWLEPLLGFPNPLALSFRSAPVDSGEVVRSMGRRMTWHRGAVEADRAQGRVGRPERLVALQDAEEVRLDLAKGEIRMIEVGLTVTLWGSDRDALERSAHMFESLCQSLLLVVRVLRYQQDVGLRRILPLGEPPDKVREMDSRAWSTFFPLSSRDVVHSHGQVLGMNPTSRSFVVVDRFVLASPHSITIGWSGAGKSFAAKLEALRSRYRGWAVSIVDPEGEYQVLQRAGATIWRVGGRGAESPGFPYDPFSIAREEDDGESGRQTEFLLRLLHRLSPELMGEFGNQVHDAVWRAVSRVNGRFSPGPEGGGVARVLLDELARESHRARDRLDMAYRRWSAAIGPVVASDSQPFEVFDFSQLADGMKGPAYLALTEWLMRRISKDGQRRLIIFDEAWHLLNDAQSAPYLEELFRRARKWGSAISLLTQDIGDFTRNRAAEVCLRNAPMVMLLRQHPESVQEVAHLLRLHEGEIQTIEASGTGEGLLLLADDHVPIRVVAAPYERTLLEGMQMTGGTR